LLTITEIGIFQLKQDIPS